MEKNNKKNKTIIFISLGLFLIVFLIVLLLLLKGKETKVNEIKELKSYVEEKGIEVLPADGKYSISVEPYFKDKKNNIIDLKDINMSKSTSTYRFYDYSVTEPDSEGYVTHTFMVDITTPIKYVKKSNKKYSYHTYTSCFRHPSIFDYYTGTVFKDTRSSKNNTVNYYDVKSTNEDMAFTEVSWKDKTYRIGVKADASIKWDGMKVAINGNGTITIKDKSTLFIKITIYAPKEYDGLMVFLNKESTSKQDLLDQIEYNNRYNELVKEFNETGVKSEELKEMEEINTSNYKLLDSNVKGQPELKNDAFYILRVNEIKPKK